MKTFRNLVRVFLLFACIHASNAGAGDLGDIKNLATAFFATNERALQCRNKEGSVDPRIIDIPKKLFSSDFMRHYEPVCLAKVDYGFIFDIRTGNPGIYQFDDSQTKFSGLKIAPPIVTAQSATVRATYDLEDASFKEWGNYTLLKLKKEGEHWKIDDIQLGGTGKDRESVTGLESIKSLKDYIDQKLAETTKRRRK